jgi:hypothetical protein
MMATWVGNEMQSLGSRAASLVREVPRKRTNCGTRSIGRYLSRMEKPTTIVSLVDAVTPNHPNPLLTAEVGDPPVYPGEIKTRPALPSLPEPMPKSFLFLLGIYLLTITIVLAIGAILSYLLGLDVFTSKPLFWILFVVGNILYTAFDYYRRPRKSRGSA